MSQPSTQNFSPARAWCFTFNNPHAALSCSTPEVAAGVVCERLKALPYVRYYIFQLEEGDSGTPHLQGYIEFSRTCRPAKLRAALPGVHVEQRRGTAQQAVQYCSKEDTRKAGPFTHGTCSVESGRGTRSDLALAQQAIKADNGSLRSVVKDQPLTFIRYSRGLMAYAARVTHSMKREPPAVYLLYGDAGCGKSRRVWDLFEGRLSRIYSKPPTGSWFCGYDQQEALVLDDFVGELPLRTLLQLLDRYRVGLEVKGAMVWLAGLRWIFITTNLHPADWYEWRRPTDRRRQYPALARRLQHVYGTPGGRVNHIQREPFLLPSGAGLFGPRSNRSIEPGFVAESAECLPQLPVVRDPLEAVADWLASLPLDEELEEEEDECIDLDNE